MRIMTTLILGLILVTVAVLIHFYGEKPDDAGEGPTPLFPGLSADAVQRIELSMFLNRKAVLERKAGNVWNVTAPFEDRARNEVVQRIIDALIRNQRTEIPLAEEERDLVAKGLEPPIYYIRFTDGKGSHTLFIGSHDPFKSETYVMINGDAKLYRTGANLRNILELNPEDMRDERIFRIDPLLVNGIVLEGPDGLIMKAVKSTGLWEITEPIRVASNSGSIQNLVSRLTALRNESRLYEGPLDDGKLEEFGLKESVFRITLLAGPISQTIVAETSGTGPHGSYLCRRNEEGAILSMDTRAVTPLLNKDVNDYRSRELMKPVREVVQHVKVLKGDELHLELQRLSEGKYFRIKAPFEASADNISDGNTTPVYNFLTQVDGIRIKEFVADGVEDLSPYGLSPADVTVEFRWKANNMRRNARLLFSKDQGSGLAYAARVDEPGLFSVYEVSAKDLEPLYRDALYLRDRRIFPQEIATIDKATFTSDSGKTYTIERNEGGFFTDDPQSRFQQFLNEMAREQVVRFVAGPELKDGPYFGKDSGAIVIRLKDEKGGAEELVVEFGTKCNDGWYGKISNQNRGIFIVSEAFIHSFEKLFFDL